MITKKQEDNFLIDFIAIYKIAISTLKIFLASLIVYFNGSLHKMIEVVLGQRVRWDELVLVSNYLLKVIIENSRSLTMILAFALLLVSSLEIGFAFLMLKRRKTGFVGMFVTSVMWIPIELLFISKFLLVPKTVSFVIDLLVIASLVHLLKGKKKDTQIQNP